MPAAPAKAGYTIRLNADRWFKIRKARKLDVDEVIARRMHVNPSTLHRVQTGKTRPSPEFIAGALHALQPATFDDLFSYGAR